MAAFIRHERVTHIYLRYFDVVLTNGTPMPNASVNVTGRVPKGVTVVPVVYITNDCMKAIGQNHTEIKDLAEKILQRVRQMTSTLQLGPVNELQIDCDWTITTRRSYFDFLSTLRNLAHDQRLQLSTTIRFHQLTQPVPPADRGVLMAYNTGDVRDINNRYPILDIADVKPYLRYLSTYQLPLSTAYPIFSWRVLFRGAISSASSTATTTIRYCRATRSSSATPTCGTFSKRIRRSANCVLTRTTRLYSMICKPIT